MHIFDVLVGKALYSVTFVKDGVKLTFSDNSELTYKLWPAVAHVEKEFKFSHPRYRDKLCDLIGSTVKEVSCLKGERFQLKLGLKATVTLSIDPKDTNLAKRELIALRDRNMKYEYISGLDVPSASLQNDNTARLARA